MSVAYKGPDGRLYRASERPDAKGEYYIEYKDPATSAVYKPLPGYHHNASRDTVVSQLAGLIKELGLQAVMLEEPAANPASTPEKPKSPGVWLYGDHRAMRVGVGNDTDRSDCRYYHVLVLNLLADKPCWRKLSGAGNYDYKHLADADAELRETLPEDAHELTMTEARQLFTSPSTGFFELKPHAVKVWDEIMATASATAPEPTSSPASAEPPEVVDECSEQDTVPAALAAPPAADIAAPVFDFSVLGDLAEQAAEDDAQFNLHYGRAQDEYLISCVYLARIHDLTAKAGRYGGGTWTKWYESKGIGEGSVRRMVETGDGFKSATVADLKNLPVLTRKDLRLIAGTGAAEAVVEAGKTGDDTKVQELLAQLKAEREGRETAEREKQEALAWKQHAEGQAEDAKAAIHAAQQTAQEAQRAAETLKQQIYRRNEELAEKEQALNTVLDQQGEYIAKIRELEKRPKDVDVVVQQPSEADIERWRKEGEERAKAALAGQAPTVEELTTLANGYAAQVDGMRAVLAQLSRGMEHQAVTRASDKLCLAADRLHDLILYGPEEYGHG